MIKEFIAELCNGNKDAEAFCLSYAELVGLVDDFIDGDKKWPKDHTIHAFTTYTINLLNNQFVKDNSNVISALILQASIDFLQSEKLAESNEAKDLAAANVLKSSWNSVLYTIAAICGGQKHALTMANKYRVYSDPKEEFKEPHEWPVKTDSIADYYDKSTKAYMDSLGDHLQITSWDKNRLISDEIQFQRCGVKNGNNLLDAGCGVLGPALNLIKLYPEVKVTGVTISKGQYEIGESRITPDIQDRIRVINADYQNSGLTSNQFDGIYFFESYCYTKYHGQIAKECLRLLKPGGWVYIIGWFLPEKDFSTKDWVDIRAHEKEWHDNAVTTQEVLSAFKEQGFNLDFHTPNVGGMLDYEPLMKSRIKADGSQSDLFAFHATTAWFDLMKMAEFRFIKE